MSEWNPSIVKIEAVINHPDADNLDIVKVLGDYPVITRRDSYKVGDLVSYIPIDSIVPNTEHFAFLSPRDFRQEEDQNGKVINIPIGPKYKAGEVPEKYRIIKAKKIRGVFSMGMIEPPIPGLVEGDSTVESLDLKKWEEPEEDNINGPKLRGANAEKEPKHFQIPYYDIESVRKYGYLLDAAEANPFKEQEARGAKEVVLREKLHGCNFMALHDDERLWVKSRNFFKKESEIDSWWEAATNEGLKEKLAKYPFYAFFGELIGLVKGFRYDTQIIDGKLKTKVKFFDIYDTKNKRYLDDAEFQRICDELNLDTAPVLYTGTWLGIDVMRKYAEGQSQLNVKHIREGFVVKPPVEEYSFKLQGRLMLKLVGEAYSLSK